MAKFVFVEWLVDWIMRQQEYYFEWDNGNSTKNKTKHGIEVSEIESVFMQVELIRVLGEQVSPKTSEPRYGIFGSSLNGNQLFVCFTLRGNGIRIISARKLNRREKLIYGALYQTR